MFDVIVVGAGPAGSLAAKKSVEHGLKTLLLEKRKLPRDKVCSGMVMRPWGQTIIAEEFGDIPRGVLVAPYYLSGHMLHAPGVTPQKVEVETPTAWRSDLDYWITQKAKEKGVEVWEEAKVINVGESGDGYAVRLIKAGEQQELKARFVIAADGANSVVRKAILPGLSLRLSTSYRECYRGALALEKDYFHWLHPTFRLRPRFQVNYKGDFFVLEASEKRWIREEAKRFLVDYGFDLTQEPLWKDGAFFPRFYQELLSGSFAPAKGNVLLIGDAAGLMTSLSDGMGTALKSALSAMAAITKAIELRTSAAGIYLRELEPILAWIERLHSLAQRIEDRAAQDPQAALDAIREAWEVSQKVEP